MQQIVHVRLLLEVACCGAALLSAAETAKAAAEGSAACAAANRGGLDMRATAGGYAAREAALDEGETLTLNVASQGRAAVTVAGASAGPEMLHSGRASSVTFVAPRSASYLFRLDADAETPATVAVTCTSLDKANAERALLDRRKAFLASRDPDRIRIDRPPTEAKALDSMTRSEVDGELPRDITASVSMSELAAAMKVGAKHDPGILDFWFEGRYTSYDTVGLDSRQADGNLSVMYLGSKYMLGPDIMLGYMAQFDQAGEYTGPGGGKLSASGWMAGPYMSVRFGPGIIFDGRAAWGVAENLPSGVALGTPSADRSLVRGTLRGTRQVGGWTVAPSVGLSYVEDTPSLAGTSFPEATPAGTGRLDVLPEMKRRFDLNSSAYVEPRVAAGGFLSFDDMSRLGAEAMQAPDLHWKAEAGVAVGVKDSMNLEATGGVETGGAEAPDTWSGRLQLNVPLNK
ncbi:MAG: autotransporter outer membrane beta-barrel domain-containing protein [Hyphomicrobium sp.]|uniref:autotransporter outer membrane beta-barrel domain-containing protein n=1 Tax=Hyphomicrobium sp. TaxID=82 RepID=UPI003D09DD71